MKYSVNTREMAERAGIDNVPTRGVGRGFWEEVVGPYFHLDDVAMINLDAFFYHCAGRAPMDLSTQPTFAHLSYVCRFAAHHNVQSGAGSSCTPHGTEGVVGFGAAQKVPPLLFRNPSVSALLLRAEAYHCAPTMDNGAERVAPRVKLSPLYISKSNYVKGAPLTGATMEESRRSVCTNAFVSPVQRALKHSILPRAARMRHPRLSRGNAVRANGCQGAIVLGGYLSVELSTFLLKRRQCCRGGGGRRESTAVDGAESAGGDARGTSLASPASFSFACVSEVAQHTQCGSNRMRSNGITREAGNFVDDLAAELWACKHELRTVAAKNTIRHLALAAALARSRGTRAGPDAGLDSHVVRYRVRQENLFKVIEETYLERFCRCATCGMTTCDHKMWQRQQLRARNMEHVRREHEIRMKQRAQREMRRHLYKQKREQLRRLMHEQRRLARLKNKKKRVLQKRGRVECIAWHREQSLQRQQLVRRPSLLRANRSRADSKSSIRDVLIVLEYIISRTASTVASDAWKEALVRDKRERLLLKRTDRELKIARKKLQLKLRVQRRLHLKEQRQLVRGNKDRTRERDRFCVCLVPYDEADPMVGCEFCDKWMHFTCASVSQCWLDGVDTFACRLCRAKDKVRETTFVSSSSSSSVFLDASTATKYACWSHDSLVVMKAHCKGGFFVADRAPYGV